MKGLIIGLIIGALAVWGWYQSPRGKISITQTLTITNTVIKTVEQTRYNDQLRWVDVCRTNEVWKTNIIERVREATTTAKSEPVVSGVTEPQNQSAAVQQVAPNKSAAASGFRGSQSITNRVAPEYRGGKKVIGHTGVHKKMGE